MAASIPAFDEKLESWDSYKERLEHYFIALDIDDPNKKKSILINCVGPSHYERVRNLCFPSSPNDKLYEELLEVFTKLFIPSIVVFKERKQFYDAKKKKTEKATNWHERIRCLALNCKFGNRIEQTLLDKFVTSFDGIVFDRFCEEGADLTLPKALEIAQRYESLEVPAAARSYAKKPPQQADEKQQKHPKVKTDTSSGSGQHHPKPKKHFVHPKNVNQPVTKIGVNMNVKKN